MSADGSGGDDQKEATKDNAPPSLAEGVELVGKFEDSGFKEPPYIARRSDGQVIQMAPMLYAVAEEVDGERSYGEIAPRVGERIKRDLAADDVRFLIDEKLRPLGVVAAAAGEPQQLKKVDPLLALKLRTAVVPEGLVNAITTVFKPAFFPPIVLAVLGGFIALEIWLFFIHGIAQSTRDLLYQPVLLLMVFGLVVLSAAFHECGHATACRYGGAKPGVMGVGIYIVWPAFYTDVTDAYRLGKLGRLRTDLGGIYFNIWFSLLTAAVYFATGFEPLLLVIVLQNMEMLHQLLPFLRLDGYYIVSDLTGVPDMLSRIGPTLKSLLPWKKADDRVTELKPWVRAATTFYVVMLVPALLLMFALLAISAPRIFATAFDSFADQLSTLGDAGLAQTLSSILQMVSLTLPILGITYTAGRGVQRLGTAAWQKGSGKPRLRAGLVVGATALAAGLIALWWPNGEYTPIGPDEKGTIGGGIEALSDVGSGTPGLGGAESDGSGIGNRDPETSADAEKGPEDGTRDAPTPAEEGDDPAAGEGTEGEPEAEPDAEEPPPESTTTPEETTPEETTPEATTTPDPASEPAP